MLQRTLPPAFRAQLVAESHAAQYAVRDPRDLPTSENRPVARDVRSARRVGTICRARRCRLVLLLHALCLYEPALHLAAPAGPETLADDPEAAELAYWRPRRAYASTCRSDAAYGHADLSGFEAILLHAPHAVPAAVNSA